jgi:ZIP family zinc transporter
MIAAGLATGVGVLPLLWMDQVPQRIVDGLLGFAAGVMLSAASFSLMVPAFETGRTLVPMLGLAAGTGLLAVGDALVPHAHASAAENGRWLDAQSAPGGNPGPALKRHVWLALAALALDNLPEGLSVGVSFASGAGYRAMALAGAIALQNIPEGLAAALPLIRSGMKRPLVLAYVGLAGLCEPLAGMLGLVLVRRTAGILPFALAFAAGAMLYAAADELLPEAFSHGFLREAVAGIIGGYALMALIERLL